MAEPGIGAWSTKHCPCCGCVLDDVPVRRSNLRHWRTACVVLLAVAILALVIGAVSRGSYLLQLCLGLTGGIAFSVNTLFTLSSTWRRNEERL
jgi:hypothetical protein